jgi:hypothetical protein
MIFVTNKGSDTLVGKYVDQRIEFPPNKSVPVEPVVARHIFGYGDDNKIPYLVRLGWMKMNTDYEKAMGKLKEFVFTDAPIKSDHLSALVVDRVAAPPLRGRGAAKVHTSRNEA